LPGPGELSSVAHGPDGWIAVGDAGSGAAPQPVAVTSADGESWQPVNGLHWNPPVALGTPGGHGGRVTALTVAGAGFTAAGQAGPAGAQRTVTWRSLDGLTWSNAAPAANGTSAVTALAAAGETVTGAAQQCGAG
jgi:hypothetical protein